MKSILMTMNLDMFKLMQKAGFDLRNNQTLEPIRKVYFYISDYGVAGEADLLEIEQINNLQHALGLSKLPEVKNKFAGPHYLHSIRIRRKLFAWKFKNIIYYPNFIKFKPSHFGIAKFPQSWCYVTIRE